MPDDPPVSQGGTERGSPLNVREGKVDRLNVTRLDVATGQVKDLQVTLLTEIRDSVSSGGGGAGGKSLQTHMESMANSMKVLVQRGDAGGGEGQGTRGFLTDLKKIEQEHEALLPILRSNRVEFTKWGKLFVSGAAIQLKSNLRELNEQVFRATQRMSDLGAGISSAVQATKNLFEISQTGLIEVTAVLDDFGAGLAKGRDSLQSTVPIIVEMAERGNLLMGTLGNSAKEIATTFMENRKIIEGTGIDLKRIPFEQQNEILSELLTQQRRIGIQGDNRDILQSRAAREQLEHLQLISFATGKSAAELLKMNAEVRKSFEELAGLGIISQEQVNTMANLEQKLAVSGQTSAVELFKEALGTVGGLNAVIAGDAGLQMYASQGRNREVLAEAYATFQRTGINQTNQAQLITEQLQSLQALAQGRAIGAYAKGGRGGLGAQIRAEALGRVPGPSSSGKDTGFVGVEEALVASHKTTGAQITGAVNAIKEFMETNLGTGLLDLGKAVLANTAALIVNSIMLGGGAAMRLLKGIMTGGAATGALLTAETMLAGSALEHATTSPGAGEGKGKKKGPRGRGSRSRARLPKGKLVATAAGWVTTAAGAVMSTAAGAIAVGAAVGGTVGYFIAKPAIDAAVGAASDVEGQTLGTTDFAENLFGGLGLGPGRDEKSRAMAKKQEQAVIDFWAKKRKQARGVSPNAPAAGASAGTGLTATSTNDPVLATLGSQNSQLDVIINLLSRANEIGVDTMERIGNFSTTGTVNVPGGPMRRVRGSNAEAFSDLQSSGGTG